MKATKKPASWFVQKLIEMGACSEAIKYARKHRTFPAAWRDCDNGAWLWWLVVSLGFKHNHMTDCIVCYPDKEASFRRRFPADRVAKALRAHK